MDILEILGHKVTHPSWGIGKIVSADDRYICAEFDNIGMKQFQFPKAFTSFLTIDDDLLQAAILEEYTKCKQEEKKSATAPNDFPSFKKAAPVTNKQELDIKDSQYKGRILEIGNSFSTHAEALNECFGFSYKHYQMAYKNLGNGYAVWFPSIAKKLWGEYISTDDYTGWVNVLSDDRKKLIQIDNEKYNKNEIREKEPDLNKRLVFAKFEEEKRYKFIGVYGSEKRIDEGFEYTCLGTKFDTASWKIIE